MLLYVPLFAFFALIIVGLATGELSLRGAFVFFAIWAASGFGVSALDISPFVFVAIEALLDIVLVFKVFGGDVRIT